MKKPVESVILVAHSSDCDYKDNPNYNGADYYFPDSGLYWGNYTGNHKVLKGRFYRWLKVQCNSSSCKFEGIINLHNLEDLARKLFNNRA